MLKFLEKNNRICIVFELIFIDLSPDMKIVIIGAGEVGFHVAKSLSELDYDISVIDIDHAKCSRANEHLDVIVNQGNGSDEKLLKNINVADADYVFCLTNSDETNLISSLQCHII